MTRSLIFGANSGTVGWYAALNLLSNSPSQIVYLFMRNPDKFTTSDTLYAGLSEENKKRLRIIQGDAWSREDVDRAMEEAFGDGENNGEGKLESIVFSIGARPKNGFGGLPAICSTDRGISFLLANPDVCERAVRNILPALGDIQEKKGSTDRIRFIAVTSMGLGERGHAKLPYALRPVWALLKQPHADKEATELLLAHYCSSPHDTTNDPFPQTLSHLFSLSSNPFYEKPVSPAPELIIVRPALLTDGGDDVGLLAALEKKDEKEEGKKQVKAAKGKTVKVQENELGAYSISRQDCGKFVAKCLVKGGEGDEYIGRRLVVTT